MLDKSEARRVERAWLSLSRANCSDLRLFAWSELWTVPLLTLYRSIDKSTASRRLRHLRVIEALAVIPGHPWPTGGRTANVYWLTDVGTQLLMRLLGAVPPVAVPHETLPQVMDEAAINRQLATLEAAIRAEMIGDHVRGSKACAPVSTAASIETLGAPSLIGRRPHVS